MIKKIFIAAVLLSAEIFFAQIPVPEKGCYHSAFTGNDTQSSFEALAKKNIAIEMFFTGWPSVNNQSSDFPKNKCDIIVAGGAIPHITWMPQVSDPKYAYPLDAIIMGSYDNYIKAYAAQVKSWGKPLFVRLGHEFNGDWYTYGGAKNGGDITYAFGDPQKADGPERFIAAYKYVHQKFKDEGVTNVTWIWCPNNGSAPSESWNTPVAYYPGDEYVDWIGFDGYNFGSSQTWSGWVGFFDIYKELYDTFSTYNKPLMIAEFASVELPGDKSEWIRQTYALNIRYSFPLIKAVTWFHIRKMEGTVDTDWRINSSEKSLKAYQDAIANDYYLSKVEFTDADEVKKEILLPDNFNLKQNYPNPFNPSTVIEFEIKNAGHVSLKVFDLLGNEIAVLVDEYKNSGSYKAEFDASKFFKSGNISSGIYFYRLTSGGVSISKNMLLLK